MKKIMGILFITIIMLTGCGLNTTNKQSESKSNNFDSKIESCPGCVFANYKQGSYVYSDTSSYSYNALTSDQYKENWNDIVNESDKDIFFGFILNDEKYITRAFVCGVENNKPFCIEGTLNDDRGGNKDTRNEVYNKNKEVLKEVYKDKCQEDDDEFSCSGKINAVLYSENDYNMRGTAQLYSGGGCLNYVVYNHGATGNRDTCK